MTDPLAAIEGKVRDVRRVQRELDELVLVARNEGASWTDIGAALGTSRQNAHKQYRWVDGLEPAHD